MALWVDKYRPHNLEKMELHQRTNSRLKKMVQTGDMPHLMFYGPSGAGKKTRIMAILRELYGPGIEKLKVEHKSFQFDTQSRKLTVETTLVTSAYHIELTPADAGIRDHLIVQKVIKEIASIVPLDSSTKRSFKVVVLNEVDRLSKQAQHALRRTMEKYSVGCRVILCCNDSSKIIAPLRSRCLLVRIPSPTEEEITKILNKISAKNGLTLPEDMARKIVRLSEGNLRKAILTLEATKVQQYPFLPDQEPQRPNWQMFVQSIAQTMVAHQTPLKLMEVRGMLYELLSHCIPAALILRTLVEELLPMLDSQLKFEVIQWAAFYEHRLHIGTKEIFHLEGFVAKFMHIYKEFLMTLQDF